MSFRISDIYKSLTRRVVETMEEIKSEGTSPNLSYFAWDTRNDTSELPSEDLIGMAGWTFSEDRGFWRIHCGITISTINDENLFREISIIDVIHDYWGEQCEIPLLDSSGAPYGSLVVNEFEMLPAGQSEKRNYRSVGLELLRTGGGY
jgi:hypothetical protein